MEDKANMAIVQTHLSTLQNIITRMSNYSQSCKTWAITLITGIIVILFDTTKTDYYYIAYFPMLLFYILDSYYLGLEKAFRTIYTEFIIQVNNKSIKLIDIEFSIKGRRLKNFCKALISVSTLPFYIIIGISLYAIKIIVK